MEVTSIAITREDIKRYLIKGPKAERTGVRCGGNGNARSSMFVYERTPPWENRAMPLRALVGAHATAAVAPTPEGATSAVAALGIWI